MQFNNGIMEINLNGKIYHAEVGTRLKDVLIELGMNFPCGGEGKCGKCKITCPSLPISNLDRRFLSENALKEGVRLACDKIVEKDLTINAVLEEVHHKKRDISECNVVATIGVKEIAIAIMDDEIVETVIVPNPLYKVEGLSELTKDYAENPLRLTKELRAILGKNSIELFEKYSQAKARTFCIATCGIYAKILTARPLDEKIEFYNALADGRNFDLPCDDVYFLPIVNEYIGGEIIAETVNYPENVMIIDCEEIFTLISIGKEKNEACSMWDINYDEIGIKAIKSAIKTMRKEETKPFVYLYGKYAELVEDTVFNENLTYTFRQKDVNNVAKACSALRYRTRLNKEKDRTNVRNLLSDEAFHTFFAEE